MPDHADSELKLQNHWHVNDEHYVRRGENAAVDAALWKRELRQANRNRRGRPYVLPPAMLDSVRCLMVELGLSYRAAQGHLRRMLSTLGMKAPDFTTIWKRLSKEQAEPVVQPREAIIAIDSTGFSTTLRGEWMRNRWHRHRGFVKAHVAVDVDTLEVVGVVTTDDTVGDNRVFASLLEQVLDRGIAVKRVLADGAYDTRDNFDMLRDRGIEAGIKMAKDATRRSRGHCLARPLAVLERKELGQEEWERRYEYWKRWMVEYVISAVKRTLGDAVSSRRRDLMFCEVQNKFWTWNMMRREE